MIGKAELLEAIAGKNRGLLASKTDKTAILAAVTQLEGRNPTPRPLEAQDLLDGNWRLLYTTSQELLNLDGFPLVQLGQIYQCVRTSDTKIYNIAELSGIPYLEGVVSVCASFEPVSQCRVNVRFERSIIGLQSFLSYSSANDFIEQIEAGKKFPAIDFPINRDNQQGWLEITYLDDDLRIGRGNQGSVFVLTKK
ncbi:MAG: fibrillin [Moorea sp. SIO1F2]|uniref:PAP/fibrillin family protein n=1 Tax=unclassified Moorena TaxID=2683338 RepID=UPI0013BD2A75|nr:MULTISPECIES: PAP/fibrillin family protein [unclassified Moorena]NEO08693.1 fibrillin [Moorena sp. SIO3I8]NEO20453.1 fibrillin [Moorena sp. SIO4A5]NEP23426.1 fibrillin [Moorena sp. SIO3I6]NEQ59989.1 fibrillin [Moorena sp. SIO4A1]NET84490.1 fibrillin [Moorena sp. SIO1F2]